MVVHIHVKMLKIPCLMKMHLKSWQTRIELYQKYN